MPEGPVGSERVTFTISELAKDFAITTRTIRFYEDQGLLMPTRNGRNRVFTRRDRTRLRLALRGKRLGLSLLEIKEILELFDSPLGEVGQLRYVVDVLDKHREALRQQKRELDALLDDIEGVRADCTARLWGTEF